MAEDEYHSRPSKEKARQNALDLLRERPRLVGEISVAIGPCWSLVETEVLLDEMFAEGLVNRETQPLVRYTRVKS